MKKNLSKLLLYLLVFSCSNEKIYKEDSFESLQSEILSFSSVEEMEEKIIEIKIIKEEKESNILKKILEKNNISESISGYKNSEKSLSVNDISYEDIKDGLEFYHKERLNSIYELREELGFISIQSVVDEINSLRLLNSVKAEELYKEINDLCVKSEFGVTSIYGDDISNILNKKGEVKVEGELLLDIEVTHDLETKNLSAKNALSNNIRNDSGILIINDYLLVAWEAGRKRNRTNLFYRYDYYFEHSGFININPDNFGGEYISYPISINSGNSVSNSVCEFRQPGRSYWIRVYPTENGVTGGSSIVRNSRSSASYYLYEIKISSATYSVNFNGINYSFEGDSFYRDYTNYDPSDPPIFN